MQSILYHCTQAGLDYAIVNTEKLERYASIPEEEIKLANDLIFNTNDETFAIFTDFYRGKKKETDSGKYSGHGGRTTGLLHRGRNKRRVNS